MMAERVECPTLRLSPGSPATTQIWMMHLHPAADSQASSDDEETDSQPAPAPLTLFSAKDSLNLGGIPDDQAAEKISEVGCIASKSINGLHNLLMQRASYFRSYQSRPALHTSTGRATTSSLRVRLKSGKAYATSGTGI